MENQSWDSNKLAEWKSFWESEVGQEYLDKLDDMKTVIFNEIMNTSDRDRISNLAGRAAGLEIVMQDIEHGIIAANERGKEEAAKDF